MSNDQRNSFLYSLRESNRCIDIAANADEESVQKIIDALKAAEEQIQEALKIYALSLL